MGCAGGSGCLGGVESEGKRGVVGRAVDEEVGGEKVKGVDDSVALVGAVVGVAWYGYVVL